MNARQNRNRRVQVLRRRCRRIICLLILVGSVILFSIWRKIQSSDSTARISQVAYHFDDDSQTTDDDLEAKAKIDESVKANADRVSLSAVNTLLVNKWTPLPERYDVELVLLPDGWNHAAKVAYKPLCAMLEDGQRQGLQFVICSSYRTVARQQELLDEDIMELMNMGYTYEDAYDEAIQDTMPPGCSEHSTGLAFDIVSASYQMLDDGQQYTNENVWLREHCAEYGFILRYPAGKEEVTGIVYEAWHFRYVGSTAAKLISEQGLTLEEYIDAEKKLP
ncbi:MAG: M15 family metallopeptidase [Clostridium sp.]|nr:M15 family metallopeptidase [Clostridium sp.]